MDKTDETEMYKNAANLVASILGEQHSFNLWKKSESEDEPASWVQNHLKNCSHVLFICTPQGSKHAEEFSRLPSTSYADEFALAYCGVLNRGRFSCTSIYFNSDSDCVPNKLRKKGKVFQLTEKIEEFLCYVSGETASNFSHEIEKLEELVSVIRANAVSSVPTSAEAQQLIDSKTNAFHGVYPASSKPRSAPTQDPMLAKLSSSISDSGVKPKSKRGFHFRVKKTAA